LVLLVSSLVLGLQGAAAEARGSLADSCDRVFVVVEESPQLVGGVSGLQARLRYPPAAKAEGVTGRVIVQFVVNAEGDVGAPEVIRGLRPALDAEAVRVIREARFVPGRQGTQAVCVRMSLPLTFRDDTPVGPPAMNNPVGDAAASVESSVSSITGRATDATQASTDVVSSVTGTVDSTTAAVGEASTAVSQGVETTKASVETVKSDVTEAAQTVKRTFRGLFGRGDDNKNDSGDANDSAAADFEAGAVLSAKIDDVPIRDRPTAGAAELITVRSTDPLVYLGEAKDGFLWVQFPGGQGWINAVLVQRAE
jgi:TonB family protein